MTRKDVHRILLNEKGQVIKQNQEWCLYEFSRVALTKCHKLCDYKQEKSILSQFWRAEVQNDGVAKALPPRRLWVESFLASGGGWPSLASSCLISVSASVATCLLLGLCLFVL